MSRLVIRADADERIGTGHIMRCLALGEAWRDGGGQVTLATRCSAESLLRRAHRRGFEVAPLIAATEAEDVRETVRVLGSRADQGSPPWLCVDGYAFSSAYPSAFREAGYPVLVVDDVAHLPEYHADVLLNQNVGAPRIDYSIDGGALRLLGVRYALLRSEILTSPRKEGSVAGVARRVLVTLGGSDPSNVTVPVVDALSRSSVAGLDVVVLVGAANPHLSSVERAVAEADSRSDGRFRLVHDASDMGERLAWADVVVSAAGSSCWEQCYLGVPSLLLVTADNQVPVAEHVQTMGAAVNLGWASEAGAERIAAEFRSLATDPGRRASMVRAGTTLVDGRGARRVVEITTAWGTVLRRYPEARLREAGPGDAEALWMLSNEAEVRSNSFRSEAIPWQDHVAWFEGKLADRRSVIWLLESEGTLMGQIRFERLDDEVAEIGFAVAADHRGAGLGAALLGLSALLAGDRLGARVVRGVVFADNPASGGAFRKARFREVAREPVRGRDCLIFEKDC